MDDLLARYAARADAYGKQADQAAADFSRAAADAEWSAGGVDGVVKLARKVRAVFDELGRRGPETCRQAKEHDAHARAYAVAAHDTEKQVADRLALANGRAESCVTVADATFVKTTYEEARRIAARMEKDLQEAVKEQQAAEGLFADHAALGQTWSKATSAAEGGVDIRRLRTLFSQRRDALGTELEGMRDAAAALRSAAEKMKELASQVADSKTHYVRAFPDAVGRWADLEQRAALSAGSQRTLSESARALAKRRDDRREAFDNTPLLLNRDAMALPPCDRSDEAARAIKATSAPRDATLGLQTTRNAAFNQDCGALQAAYASAMQIGQLARAQWALTTAQSKGCNVPSAAMSSLAQALETERMNNQQSEQERIQRQMDALQGFIEGMNTMLQNQQRPPATDNLGPNPMPLGPAPAAPPAGSGASGNTTTWQGRPPAQPQPCRNVCVQEHTVWYSSDGRHRACWPNGVPNPRCVGVKCTRGTVCDRWERRCGP